MDVLTIVYLIYSFISIYFLCFFMLIYIPNRKKIPVSPLITKEYSLSIVVPCYNEEKHIGGTIEALLNSDYKGLKKIIVVDDCSTDGSYKIIKEYAKKYSKVFATQTPKNTGNAAGAKSHGVQFVKTELIGFTDSDSYPAKDALSKMIGYFDEGRVGAVTSMVLVKNRDNFLGKVQAIEYKMIAFTRKLLGFVEAIYVTPGPLAIYRKSAFDKIGGFDLKNMTEDIEITWHLVSAGYVIKMSSLARVHCISPSKIKMWFKQRIRWNLGGIQTISKYKNHFFKAGMLGNFILPYFIFNWVLGVFGLSVLAYRVVRMLIVRYFATTYSIQTQAAIMTFNDISLTPNILVFFGIATLIMNLFMVGIALMYGREEGKKDSLINIVFYMFFYLLAYPVILFTSIYKFFRGNNTWMTK